jgi:hypothetical protein
VRLVETPAVRQARRGVNAIIDEINAPAEDAIFRGSPIRDALGTPYVANRDQLLAAGRALADAMRDDLGFPPG